MAGYMERCTGCGCWTDYSNKATTVCADCQRAVAVAVRADQPPDLATLQAHITTLEALLLEARTALKQAVAAMVTVHESSGRTWEGGREESISADLDAVSNATAGATAALRHIDAAKPGGGQGGS